MNSTYFRKHTSVVYFLSWVIYFSVFFVVTTKLDHRKIAGYFERFISPGYGSCGRCGRPWNWCDSHSTIYRDFEPILFTDSQSITLDIEKDYKYFGTGCFPLCKECWSELTPKQRLPYYRQLVGDWVAYASDYKNMKQLIASWPSIEKAVLEGR